MMTSTRRGVLMGLGATGLSGCVTRPLVSRPAFATPPLAPLLMEADRITRITVCLRPFRATGPRMDVETLGAKRIVHNYGHGGSGWSLSWGSAAIATRNAMAGGTRDVAVIGCGAIGLTSAILLQRAGARVTIYAKDRTPYTRSARATGTWTPDSRIADADKVSADFPALWEQMARASYAAHHTYVGLPGDPVSFADRYSLYGPGDHAPAPPPGPRIRFADYRDRIADLVPSGHAVSPSEHPFPVDRVSRGISMQFNVADLAHRLTSDFLIEGGRIEQAEFATPSDLARLPQPVVVNCTGYGARDLWRDTSIVPVRGQIAWLAPQPEVHYGLYYHHVLALPRPDGIVVQQIGQSDMWGYDDANETPDQAEAEAAIATLAGLFARSPRPSSRT